MLVKTLDELRQQGDEVTIFDGQLRRVRFLTRRDGLGFTLSDVRGNAGLDQVLWYKNHWEANHIVAGDLTVEDLNRGEAWQLGPGSTYVVGPNDRHRLLAVSDFHLVSVFNPALVGDETHDAEGSYSPSGPVPAGRERMFVKTVATLREAGRERIVAGGSARTLRLLLQEDRVGFTLCDVNLAAGNRNMLWYKHHWEANYILEGSGEVSDLTCGQSWKMEPGMLYIVGPDDRHSMQAHTDLHLLSVFNPPLQGDEMHDSEGTLPASGPLPPGLPRD